VALSAALLPLGVAATSEAAVLPALLAATVRAALGAAPSPAAAASAQAAALAQGVIQAMFLAKLKAFGVGLLVVALLGTGAGVATYRAQAQGSRPNSAARQGRQAAQPPRGEMDPAQMKREIERLRLELEQTRLLLKLANQEILDLRADRERAAKGRPGGPDRDPRVDQGAGDRAGKAVDQGLQPSAPKGVSSPDRKVIAAAHGRFFSLLDAQTGKKLRQFAGHTDTVTALAFSPDGKRLASGSQDRSAGLWDVASGKQLLKFEARHPVESVAFSPDGRTLVIGHKGQTSELDILSGKIIRVSKN
jgi:hypothetical protein